jgi:hypothetical protein
MLPGMVSGWEGNKAAIACWIGEAERLGVKAVGWVWMNQSVFFKSFPYLNLRGSQRMKPARAGQLCGSTAVATYPCRDTPRVW